MLLSLVYIFLTYIYILSQFVNRPFNHHMDIISHYILHMMNHHPLYVGRDDVVIELTNHMTHLSFYHKREEKQSDTQLAYHCDCLWTDDGQWISHKNSQKMNSPTYSLTVGDGRILKFKKWKAGVGKEGARSDLIEIEVRSNNGDLLILDPRDEKLMMRPGDDCRTKFKHGDIKVSKEDGDKLSVGLIFRSVTSKQQFDPENGKFIVSPEFWSGLSFQKQQEYLRRDNILTEYKKSGGMQKSYNRLKHIFDGMYSRHFNTKS